VPTVPPLLPFRRSWNSTNERLQPHLYRREERGPSSFEAIGDSDAILNLKSVGLEIQLSEIYQFVNLENKEDNEEGDVPNE
jgi:hypothetical protein